MLTVFAVACLILAVVLGVALWRTRARVHDLEEVLERTAAAHDARAAEVITARQAAAAAERQRDDARERVQRARRDAAEVATRLRDESNARAELEVELATSNAALEEARASLTTLADTSVALDAARAELADNRAALEEARAVAASPSAGPLDVEAARFGDELWSLALRSVEHTWRISVAPGLDVASPLEGADDVFRAAVEIEVDAAREESGAQLELSWGDDTGTPAVEPPAECAALALAVVRDVISTLGTTASRTDLTVCSSADAVDVRVTAVDDVGNSIEVPLPPSLRVAPGHARVVAS